MERALYPITEAAYRLGIGRTKLYELVAAGEITTVRIGGRTLIKAETIDAYVAGLTTQAGSGSAL